MSGSGKASSGGGGREDFEEDHLLSYFLSGEANASNQNVGERAGDKNGAAVHAPTAKDATAMPQGGYSTGSLASGGGGASKTIRFSLTNGGGSGGSSPAVAHQPGAGPAAVGALKTDKMMPPTPAVQFYAAPSKKGDKSPSNQSPLQMPHGAMAGQGQGISPTHGFRPLSGVAQQQGGGIPRVPSRAPSTSSSSSSIASMGMAFALNSGTTGAGVPAPMQQVHPHVQMQSMTAPMVMPMQVQGPPNPSQMQGQSPISPAAMIGTPENMMLPCTPDNMLPPPPRFPSGSNGMMPQNQTQIQAQQQQHAQMIGMQHMNMVAAMNGGGAAFPGMPVPHQQPQQRQPMMQMPMPPPGVVPPPQLHVAGAPFPNPFLQQNGGQSPLVAHHQQKRVIPAGQPGQNVSPVPHPQQQHMNVSPLPHPQQQSPSGMPAPLSTTQPTQAISASTFNPTSTAPAPVIDPADAERMAQQIHRAAARASAGGASASKPAPTPAESAEKRARRLARNRESARQSRRRKKELLIKLGGQVNKLYDEIEDERRNQISKMEGEMAGKRRELFEELSRKTRESRPGCAELREELASVVRETGPDCPPRQAVTNFQYNSLRMMLLTYFRRYLLWMTTRHPSYFLAGKEERGKSTRTTSGRISSKQIGEELTTAHKTAMKGIKATERKGLSCTVDKPAHFWPLFAYEMSLSVDQEERWLQAHQRCIDTPQLPQNRSDAEVATSMVSSIKTAIMYQSHSAGHRNQLALLDVLSPEQSVRYLEWFARNKERCDRVVAKKVKSEDCCGSGKNETTSDADQTPSSQMKDAGEKETLNEICRRLNEALNIRSTE